MKKNIKYIRRLIVMHWLLSICASCVCASHYHENVFAMSLFLIIIISSLFYHKIDFIVIDNCDVLNVNYFFGMSFIKRNRFRIKIDDVKRIYIDEEFVFKHAENYAGPIYFVRYFMFGYFFYERDVRIIIESEGAENQLIQLNMKRRKIEEFIKNANHTIAKSPPPPRLAQTTNKV